MLGRHLVEIHTITLRWRRGSAFYKPMPIPHSTFVLAGIDFDKAPDKKAKEDLRAWTGEHAEKLLEGDIWPKCVRMARAEGPVIDVQLSLYGYDEKTGELELLCDSHGTRINLDPSTAPRIDDPYDNKTEAMVSLVEAQTDAIKERDAGNKALMGEQIKMVQAVTSVTTGVLDVARQAIGMKSEVAGRNDEEQAREREFELRKLRTEKQHESFKAALEKFPFDDLGLYWRARAAGVTMDVPDDCRDAARKLLDSLTDEQLSQLDDDLAADIRSVLANALKQEDEEMAKLVLLSLLPKLLTNQEAISKVITNEQAALLTFLEGELKKMRP